MRRAGKGTIVAALGAVLLAAAPLATAELVSKRFQFKSGVILEMALPLEGGVRLETVRFDMPSALDGRISRAGGLPTVRIVVSNSSSEPRRVGLAVALYDDQERMLAVASGGSKMSVLKAGGRKTFTLTFDGVYAEANKATTFQISVEPRS